MARALGREQDSDFRLALDVRGLRLKDDEFIRLCRDNPDLRFELTADGELIVMSPTGSETGRRNSRIHLRLAQWAELDGTGVCFDSSAGFTLLGGAKRSPDASWALRERWDRLTAQEQEGLAPLCPDFVVELRSPSDRLNDIEDKMREYMLNGAKLGWLLDPIDGCAWIHRPEHPPECLLNPEELSGGDVLPGFRFNFREITRP